LTELAILLPLLAFVALAAGFAIVLRRAGRIVARTREIEGFRSSVRDLANRIDHSLEGAAGRIDAVRRQQLAADTIGATIAAATDAVARYTEEARALHGPAEVTAIRDELVADLERVDRAIAMVDHGAKIMAMNRRRGREIEAQTAIKRGYLNLIHAREAISRHAAAAEALESAPEPATAEGPVSVRQPRP
jgi:hypothetical protein